MTSNDLSYFLALGATLCFSSASLVYAEYSKRLSVLWVNTFKALVAFVCLAVTIPIFVGWHAPLPAAVGGLMLSGLIGLNIGDLFLLKAYTRLGVARTLILFGFQPLMLGAAAFYLFDQPMNPMRLLAVVFLIGCLFIFSYERYRLEKRWEVSGLFYALMGVTLDACGILITRACFGASPEITPMEGHFYRCLGALIGFAVIARFYRPIQLKEQFFQRDITTRWLLFAAGFAGAYLSLLLYLTAVKIGHLASISGIAITGPMFATGLESLLHKKLPSRYFFLAFLLFCIGFYVLLAIP